MILPIVLSILMILVIAYDVSRYIIPNWLNGVILLLFPYILFTTPGVDWQMAYLGMLATFAFGFALYALKLMGAGDVKLLAVLAPFLAASGYTNLVEFLIYMTIAGGLFSLFLIIIRKIIPWVVVLPKDDTKLRILRDKAPVPYGVAIAVVFLVYLWTDKISVIPVT